MAFLVVGGVTVDVKVNDAEEEVEEIGQRRRAIDGTMRSSVTTRKSQWSVTTVPLTTAEKDTLVTALDGTPPITCSGDLLGASTSCLIERGRTRPVTVSGGTTNWILSFTLFEE